LRIQHKNKRKTTMVRLQEFEYIFTFNPFFLLKLFKTIYHLLLV